MTSDGISKVDWDELHLLAVDVANAETDEEERLARESLLRHLSMLETRYGRRPSLLATRADYVDTDAEAERLLLEAYEVAGAFRDVANLKEVALSLSTLYAIQLRDLERARHWLETAETWGASSVGRDGAEYREITDAIEVLAEAQDRPKRK